MMYGGDDSDDSSSEDDDGFSEDDDSTSDDENYPLQDGGRWAPLEADAPKRPLELLSLFAVTAAMAFWPR